MDLPGVRVACERCWQNMKRSHSLTVFKRTLLTVRVSLASRAERSERVTHEGHAMANSADVCVCCLNAYIRIYMCVRVTFPPSHAAPCSSFFACNNPLAMHTIVWWWEEKREGKRTRKGKRAKRNGNRRWVGGERGFAFWNGLQDAFSDRNTSTSYTFWKIRSGEIVEQDQSAWLLWGKRMKEGRGMRGTGTRQSFLVFGTFCLFNSPLSLSHTQL